MKHKVILIALSLQLSFLLSGYSQSQSSIISGVVIDKQSGFTIPGANVAITTVSPMLGTSTDLNGKFVIKDVPVGRHSLQISFLGYKTVVIPNVLVSVAKEANVNIELLENVENLKEVVEHLRHLTESGAADETI